MALQVVVFVLLDFLLQLGNDQARSDQVPRVLADVAGVVSSGDSVVVAVVDDLGNDKSDGDGADHDAYSDEHLLVAVICVGA